MQTLTIQTDGGARGNPGLAACAAVFLDPHSKIIAQTSRFLGPATNNQAEYQGVILALNYLLKHPDKFPLFNSLEFILDSELIVKQLQGHYKIKAPQLQQLSLQVFRLLAQLNLPTHFHHVKRHHNRLPDQLLNQTLDQHHS